VIIYFVIVSFEFVISCLREYIEISHAAASSSLSRVLKPRIEDGKCSEEERTHELNLNHSPGFFQFYVSALGGLSEWVGKESRCCCKRE